MRHQHQRGSFALIQRDEKFQHMLAVLGIEIASGLVRQQNRRPDHEGAGQRHALLLAARKLNGVMIAAIEKADAFEQLANTLWPIDSITAGEFIRAMRSSFSPVMSSPSRTIRPEVGVSNPARRPSRVLLPLPDGPIMATNSPRSISRSIPRRISTRCVAVGMLLVSAKT